MKICVDAGHGMSNKKTGVFDPGAVHTENGFQFQEAVIALHYALTLRKAFNDAGIPVFMTRDDQEDHAPVSKRASNAKAAGCDIFISLHLNDFDSDVANGLETLFNDIADKHFAQKIQQALLDTLLLKDRKIKQRTDLAVLKFNGSAVLIELGFIANDKDRQTLLDPLKRSEACNAIVAAVQNQFSV